MKKYLPTLLLLAFCLASCEALGGDPDMADKPVEAIVQTVSDPNVIEAVGKTITAVGIATGLSGLALIGTVIVGISQLLRKK